MNLVASPLRPLIRHWRHWYARDACNEPVRPPFMILLSVPLTAGCCCCLFFGFRSVHISPGYSFNSIQFNFIETPPIDSSCCFVHRFLGQPAQIIFPSPPHYDLLLVLLVVLYYQVQPITIPGWIYCELVPAVARQCHCASLSRLISM